MLARFIPREGKFFDLFRRSAELIVEGSVEFEKMLSDLSHAESYASKIKSIEHEADEVTHTTVETLHMTFITPLDREDILKLISKMDDILDFIEAAAERVSLYQITTATPELKALANVCVRSARDVQRVINELENLKKSVDIRKICVEINRLENEADGILRAGMAKLFREETDVKQLIKFKEIYELLETVTDCCEDVANIVEGIVLEYS